MTVSGRRSGQVMSQKVCQPRDPSICAASYTSGEIDCKPARYPTVKNGVPRQMFAIISDIRASHESPRKSMFVFNSPSLTSDQLMKLNCGSKIHHHANAESTVGTT